MEGKITSGGRNSNFEWILKRRVPNGYSAGKLDRNSKQSQLPQLKMFFSKY